MNLNLKFIVSSYNERGGGLRKIKILFQNLV